MNLYNLPKEIIITIFKFSTDKSPMMVAFPWLKYVKFLCDYCERKPANFLIKQLMINNYKSCRSCCGKIDQEELALCGNSCTIFNRYQYHNSSLYLDNLDNFNGPNNMKKIVPGSKGYILKESDIDSEVDNCLVCYPKIKIELIKDSSSNSCVRNHVIMYKNNFKRYNFTHNEELINHIKKTNRKTKDDYIYRLIEILERKYKHLTIL